MGWKKRIGISVLLLAIASAVPITRNELACMRPRETPVVSYNAVLPETERRNLVDTFLTYPEWSIVHAYEDLAVVTRQKGEHHFGYVSAVTGYWSSLCALSKVASQRGDITLDMKAVLYIIGVSFAGEMAVKGLYESTAGRFTAWLRGPEPTPDDNFAAKVAEDYARFLRQTPWYQYPFWMKLKEFWSHRESGKASLIRTVERRVALTLEYGVKAIYAKAMGILAGASPAKLTIQSVVSDLPEQWFRQTKGITIISTQPEGVRVETQRYRAFTDFMRDVASANGTMNEIAGHDRIFVTAVSDGHAKPVEGGFAFSARSPNGIEKSARAIVMFSVPIQAKQGAERFGIEIAVADLTAFMRAAAGLGLVFEHAYDY